MKQRPIRDFRAIAYGGLRAAQGRPFKGIRISLPLAAVALAALLAWSLHDVSAFGLLRSPGEPVIVLEAADGRELGRSGPMRGVPVRRQDLPPHLVNAVLAIEDRRFYSHWGIDPKGVARALARNFKAGEVREGGSTITQQLARTLLGEDDRTMRRKIREAVLAAIMEGYFSKDEILTLYLNNIYFGAGVTGVSGAAQVYFDKDVKDLTLAEAAMIAGMIQAPSQLNPLRNLKAAGERAAVVLDAMVDSGTLEEATAKKAKTHPAKLNPGRPPANIGPWFADWVHGEALKLLAGVEPKPAAARVRTTIVPEIQAWAEKTVSAVMRKQAKESGVGQVALVAMRPDGAVVAMVGGRDYEKSQFNRATQAMRQPGSTFKLFVYLAALRNGFSLYDKVEDAPMAIGKWRPKNFDNQYHGSVTLMEAFARSLNVATVRLAQAVGIDEVVEAARLMGIDAPLKATPSLALGSSEVSLIDLTGAYASVRAGEAPTEPYGIAEMAALDEPRRIAPAQRAQRSPLDHNWSLTVLLREAVEHGTGRSAQLDAFTAGKTGTTENHRDGWFVGFNDELVTGVWVGNDDNSPTAKVTGGKLPATIFREFMIGASKLLRQEVPVAEAADPPGGNMISPSPQQAQESPRSAEVLIMGGFGRGDREEALQLSPLRCDFEACSRAYRSFRPSDCTFQPYRGGRRLCTKGTAGLLENTEDSAELDASTESEFGEETPVLECNYAACERRYRSFRASDCSYQPYSGPRRLCLIEAEEEWEWQEAAEDGADGDIYDEEIYDGPYFDFD